MDQVEVVGPLQQAQFPELCLKCGEYANRTLPVTKLFWRSGSNDEPSYYVVSQVNAPFCPACVQEHEHEQQPVAPAVKQRLLRGWLVQALPYLFPLAVSLWFVSIMVPKLLQALVQRSEWWQSLIGAGVCGFFGLLAWMFYRIIRDAGRRLILEPAGSSAHYVQVQPGPLGSRFIVPTEPTSVLDALDFTDDRSELFDSERHLFTFENSVAAAKFAELNAHRSWDPASPPALRAGKARKALFIGVVVLGLYLILRELVG